MLTQDLLNEIFIYNKDTGTLCRRDSPYPPNESSTKSPYSQVKIQGKAHSTHRIIWLMVYGHIPKGMEIDHINGTKKDNRLSNLRLSTPSENKRNRAQYACNTTGFKGVFASRGKFRAAIVVDKKYKHLGEYESPEAAAVVYDKAALVHFGEFARTNSMMGLLPNTSANV